MVKNTITDVATVEELGNRVGSKKKAIELLRNLDVPITNGVFSQRLFLARLEHRPSAADSDLVDRASAALVRYGLVVLNIHRGHPTKLVLSAHDTPICVEAAQYKAPSFIVRPGEKIEAAFYSTKKRTSNAVAGFGISGLDNESGPPLFILYLASEDRLWIVRGDELRTYHRLVSEGGRQRWFTRTPRKGSIRVSFHRPKNLFDADNCLIKEST